MTRALRHEWHSLLYDPDVGLSIPAKLVGCVLIEHADRDGVAWPSLPWIGTCAGLRSRHTVLKGMEELERRGLLGVERRAGCVNRYRLVLPPLTSASDARVPVHEPVHEPVHYVHPNQTTKEPKNNPPKSPQRGDGDGSNNELTHDLQPRRRRDRRSNEQRIADAVARGEHE